MTEPTDPNPGQPRAAEQMPLDYAQPTGGLPRAAQLTLGVAISLAVMLPLTFFGPLVVGMAGAVIGPLIGASILGSIAVNLKGSDRNKGWAAGLWIGIGIALLLDGICWIAISQMRF